MIDYVFSFPVTPLLTMTAYDRDSSNTPAGNVSYRITGGSKDKFNINPITGVIYVTPGTTFNYNDPNDRLFTLIVSYFT